VYILQLSDSDKWDADALDELVCPMLISSAVEAVGHPYLVAKKAWFITLKDWFNRRYLGKIPPKRKENLYGELPSSQPWAFLRLTDQFET
jgi:hypothetical protein